MNHHFANVGDVMKHLALTRVAELVRPRRYLESHAGAFDYPLAGREGPLPDGVWDFLASAPSVHTLERSAYTCLLDEIAGAPSDPGVYPGSTRCVWSVIGASAEYFANDIDPEALDALGRALTSRGAQARLSSEDGIDMVIDHARYRDLVLIDPFDPDLPGPKHGLTSCEAFDELTARGAIVLLWRALHEAVSDAPAVSTSDLTVTLRFDEPTGSMDGCELILSNIGPELAADVGRLMIAHGGILGNGWILAGAARRRSMTGPAHEPVASNVAPPVETPPTRFDRYVMVDWSALSTPSRVQPAPDAIWIADLSQAGQEEIYCRVRAVATEVIRAILRDAVIRKQRVLIGFDFPFGYPRGFAAALGLDPHIPWKSIWLDLAERIADDRKNSNNRFDVARAYNQRTSEGPGPFWGCPAIHDFGGLTARAKGVLSFPYAVSAGELARFRATEVLIPGTVQEVWKLTGNGSVGSQALVGINRVAGLRFAPEFEEISHVWPFETGLQAPELPAGSPAIVFAEIWPGIVDADSLSALMAKGLIRDQAQVRLMCEWAQRHDVAGTLADYLAPPQALDGHADAVVSEEGWILGCL